MFGNFKISLLLLLSAVVCQAADMPDAIRWIPRDAIICVEVSEPRAVLEALADDEACAAITGLPIYKGLASNPKFKEFVNVIRMFEVSLEMDWRTGLGKLTGGGITLAVCPDDMLVTIIDAEDEGTLKRLHEILVGIAKSEADKAGESGRVASADYLGVTGWTFNGKEAHAIIGKRLIIANKVEGLKSILEMRGKGEDASVVSREDYVAARKAVGSEAVGMVTVNLEILKNVPDIAKLLDQDRTNPLAALLLAPIIESVRNSKWMALGINIEKNELVLQAFLDGKGIDPASAAGFAVPGKEGDGAMPNFSVPRRIAAFSFYRDLHKFYANKDDLFGERTSGLIFFENMMGIFFSGRDLTDEVLGQTTPDVRFVVARQEYSSTNGIPEVQMPAFALVLELRDAEEFDEVAEEAWQKAIGLVNFTRGQQAMPGLIIDKPMHGDMKFTTAYFSTAGMEETTSLPTRFNIRPSLAVAGDHLILSSTDGLTHDLIDAVLAEESKTVKPLGGIHSVVEMDGDEVAAILQANFEAMVRKNMVDKGNTEEEAEGSTRIMIAVSELIDHVELSVGSEGEFTSATLKVGLDL